MKQLLFLLLSFPLLSYGQVISPFELGVSSKTQFTPDGQHVGAFMQIGAEDSIPVFGYRTKAGYIYQLTAPYLTGDFSGTAVSEEYVDSIISSIPSLRIGARVPGARPNTVAYFDRGQRLMSNPGLSYNTDIPGSEVLTLTSDQGFSTTGSYQSFDGHGNSIFFGGEFKGLAAYNYVQDASGNNYADMLSMNDGSDVEFDMNTDFGGFTLMVDPNYGGALFSNDVESYSDFDALDGSGISTAGMGDGFVITNTEDKKFSVFIETSSDGITNHLGIQNPAGTVFLNESPTGSTLNMKLPQFPDDSTAGLAGLVKGDLYEDLAFIVHIKK